MALKNTMEQLGKMLEQVTKDLMKAHRGNKAACQRVRTGSIKLEKVAKVFRKESVKAEKNGSFKKAPAAKKAAKKATKKKAAPKKKAAKKKAAPRRKAPARKAGGARRRAAGRRR